MVEREQQLNRTYMFYLFYMVNKKTRIHSSTTTLKTPVNIGQRNLIERNIMPTLTISKARKRLDSILDDAAIAHQGFCIVGKKNQAVLISMEDWNSIQETLYLNSFPGLASSIVEGMATPVSECSKELTW